MKWPGLGVSTAAAASAHDEDDDVEQVRAAIEARDERLSAVALVARAAPSATVPLLAHLVSERCTWLLQVCTPKIFLH
jgi:hypothetical protein